MTTTEQPPSAPHTFDARAFRRDIHAHPEVAFKEVRTSALIAAELARIGLTPRVGAACIDVSGVIDYPGDEELDAAAAHAVATGADPTWVARVRDGGTGVVVEIPGDRPGPTWALRCDIDALAIDESQDPGHVPMREGFVSTLPGRMHACGHDGHAAIGLGIAHELAADRDFAGALRVVFQPAEEGGRGAQAMLRADVMDGVDRFVALHLGVGRATRDVIGGVVGGFATDKLRARITGHAAHAALSPEQGRNALAAAAQATLGILGQPRWSQGPTRINVGRLVAGDAVNVIPGWADMLVEARSTDDDVQAGLREAIERILRGSAAAHGCEVDVIRTGGSITLRSDDELSAAFAEAARAVGGVGAVHGDFDASDDASLLMRAVQSAGGTACYTVVGANNPAPHHSALFDIDEESISFAIAVLSAVIRQQRAGRSRS